MADDQDTTTAAPADPDRASAFDTALSALKLGWQGTPEAEASAQVGSASSPTAGALGYTLGKVGRVASLPYRLMAAPANLARDKVAPFLMRGTAGVADYAGEKPVGDMLRSGANQIDPTTLTASLAPTPGATPSAPVGAGGGAGGAAASGAGGVPVPGAAAPPAGARAPMRPGGAGGGVAPGQADLAAANDAQQKGAQAQADAEKASNDAETPVQADLGSKQQQIATDVQAKQAAALQATQDRLQHLQGIADKFENADIDPNAYMKSLGGFDRVMAHISMALGGLGGGLQGKSNTSPVVDQINQNIALQTQKLERAKTAFDMNNTIVGQLYAQTKNLGEAATLAQDIYSKAAISKLEAIKLGTANPRVQAIADQHIAELKANRVQAAQKLTGDVADTNLKKAQTVDTYASARLKNAEAGKASAAAKNATAGQLVNIGGQLVPIPDEKEREAVRNMVTSGATMTGALRKNIDSQADAGVMSKLAQMPLLNKLLPAPAAAREAMAARDAAAMSANKSLGIDQAMSVPQFEAFKESNNNPFNTDANKRAGNEYVSSARTALASRLMASGYSSQMAQALALKQYPPMAGDTSSVPGLTPGFK